MSATKNSQIAIEKQTDPLKLHPKRVASKLAVTWVMQGLSIYKAHFLSLILVGVVFIMSQLLVVYLQFVGIILLCLFTPVLTAGFMYMLDQASHTKSVVITDLFMGFKRACGVLVGLGAAQLGMIFACLIITGFVFLTLFASHPVLQELLEMQNAQLQGQMEMQQIQQAQIGMLAKLYETQPQELLLVALVFVALVLPVSLMVLYAPALIILNRQTLGHALTKSLVACIKNFIPLLVYSLVLLGILLLVGIVVGIVLALSSSALLQQIIAIIWTLIITPYVSVTLYLSYRDIFLPVEEEGEPEAIEEPGAIS